MAEVDNVLCVNVVSPEALKPQELPSCGTGLFANSCKAAELLIPVCTFAKLAVSASNCKAVSNSVDCSLTYAVKLDTVNAIFICF
jgi:hypothetical protein